jgi:DNA polymerase III epsilon subunit-like protein
MKEKLLFLDTETTGNLPNDRLCQLCYKLGDMTVNELYKPPVPITIESMAIHHITEEMVAEKPAFQNSKEYNELEKLFSDEGIIFTAHNAKFDLLILKKEGLAPKKVIDTYRVARYLDPEAKIPSYRLQYLRYFLGIKIEAVAHDAFGDVLVLEKLFERLLKKIMEKENLSEDEAIEKMADISSHPVIFKTINFGKYRNRDLKELADEDPNYLRWLLEQKRQNPDEEEDWIYTLETFLQIR